MRRLALLALTLTLVTGCGVAPTGYAVYGDRAQAMAAKKRAIPSQATLKKELERAIATWQKNDTVEVLELTVDDDGEEAFVRIKASIELEEDGRVKKYVVTAAYMFETKKVKVTSMGMPGASI